MSLKKPELYRGHEIRQVGDSEVWVYADTGEPVPNNPFRACGHCGKPNTPEGHDGCIGTMPGVMNACCGHGIPKEAFVQYPDGRRLAGYEALRAIEKHIRCTKGYER